MSRDRVSDKRLADMALSGMTSGEIGRSVGMSPGAVRGRLQRMEAAHTKSQLAFVTLMLCDLLDGCKGPHEIVEQTGMAQERAEAIYDWWRTMSHPGMVRVRPPVGDAALAWLDDERTTMKCIAIDDVEAHGERYKALANSLQSEPQAGNYRANAEVLALAVAVLKELTPAWGESEEPAERLEPALSEPEPIHFIINGESVRLQPNGEFTLNGLMAVALRQSGNVGRPHTEWQAVTMDGQPLALDINPATLRGRMVLLSPHFARSAEPSPFKGMGLAEEAAPSGRITAPEGGPGSAIKEYTARRNLTEVIDAVAALVPELTDDLRNVRASVPYTAPEMILDRWAEAQEILVERVPPEHPKYAEVLAIWNDAPRVVKLTFVIGGQNVSVETPRATRLDAAALMARQASGWDAHQDWDLRDVSGKLLEIHTEAGNVVGPVRMSRTVGHGG